MRFWTLCAPPRKAPFAALSLIDASFTVSFALCTEAQKRVSTEIAQQMADYLLRDEARCALNAPAVPSEEMALLRPYVSLARRLGLMLAQVADKPLQRLEIEYIGRVAEMGTGPLRVAAIAGVLAPSLDGPVNAVNAEMLAAERGLKVLEAHEPDGRSDFASLLKIHAYEADDTVHMAAGSVFRGEPRLAVFEGFVVDFAPRGHLLMTRHDDSPGVLGQVATWLGDRGVNIGGMHMAPSRKADEPALALFRVDRALTAEEEKSLTEIPAIRRASSLTL